MILSQIVLEPKGSDLGGRIWILIEKSICPRPLWGGERGKENDRV
jgi:hypothetical protein